MSEIDYASCTSADLRELDRLNIEMADVLIARLQKRYPRTWKDFFPPHIAPTPDLFLAEACGLETLEDVASAATCVIIAMSAREELSTRKYPN